MKNRFTASLHLALLLALLASTSSVSAQPVYAPPTPVPAPQKVTEIKTTNIMDLRLGVTSLVFSSEGVKYVYTPYGMDIQTEAPVYLLMLVSELRRAQSISFVAYASADANQRANGLLDVHDLTLNYDSLK